MKKIYFIITFFLFGSFAVAQDLVISAVYDCPLTGGTPKGIELYVKANIADLSSYGVGSATNGPTDGQEFTFPAVSATAGDYIYIASESTQFSAFFGFAPDYTDASMGINGDDGIELFQSSTVIDVYGDIGTDGTGQAWEYTDGWAYRNNNTGPDGSTFTAGNWTISGINVLDGETSNSTAATPVPIGTYTDGGGSTNPEPSNHVTSFSAVANGATQIDLTWTDNDGANAADKFLILASASTITPPVDGTDPTPDNVLSDGSAAVDVSSGVGTYSFTGLDPSTTYNFEIYPFANSSANIDFKTDGTVPSDAATTAASPYNAGDVIITEIMYNTPSNDEEWIEIYNASGSSINFDSDWSLNSTSASWTYSFDGSLTLANGAYASIQCGSSGAFPFTPDLVRSSSSNQLGNTSGTISVDYLTVTVDEVSYTDDDSPITDGGGPSLSLTDVTADNSNMDNWIGSGTIGTTTDGGTPGAANSDVTAWTGNSSTAWGTSGNWDNGVPASGVSAFIPSGSSDLDVTSDEACASLRIPSGVTINVNSGSLSVNSELALNGSMTVASGASLLPLSTREGSGSATINRNTTFGVSDGQYSAIGSPITSGSTSDLGGIVYSYDETIAYGANGNNRFVSVASPETISQGDAYFSANTGNISFVGTPNGGDENITLIYDETNDGGATNAGFNLVSNPYPAAILYTDFINGTTNLDVDGTLYFWDDGGSDLGQRDNNDYVTATGIGAASGGSGRSGSWDGYIRSAQGFFVKATTAGTLNFTPSMMSTGNNTDGGFFREAQPETVRLALTSSKLYNDILIGFTEDATTAFDRTLDAYKIKGNPNLQLYSKMGAASMAIQALPILTEEVTMPLGFDVAQAGTYTFELPETLTYGFEVYLVDHKLDKMINLSEGSYSFETQAVIDSDRFSLVFSPNKILSIDNTALDNNKLVVFSGSDLLYIRLDHVLNDATIKIYDLSGTLVKQIEQVDFNGQDIQTNFDREGLYIITVQSSNQLLVKKFVR